MNNNDLQTNTALQPDLHKASVVGSGFKKILVKKDGSTWHLTDAEVELWEKDGSITTGDILYKVVTDTLY